MSGSVPPTPLSESAAPGAEDSSLRRHLTTLIVVVVTGAAIAAAAYLSNQPAQATTTLPDGSVTAITITGTATGDPPTVGKPAPDFLATSTDGKLVHLSDLKGKPVWLTFGASWCQPCRAENPDIEAAFEKYKDQGLVVLQVYVTEDAKTVTDYAGRVGLSYSKIPDPTQRLAAEYRILGIPSHFFIDRTGTLRQLRIGSLDPPAIETAVRAILP
jgi:cytochrome c biogenesis protein CcmG, thiol:disulfide interchange protein DsbE